MKGRGLVLFCKFSILHTPLMKELVLSKLVTDTGDRATADLETLYY